LLPHRHPSINFNQLKRCPVTNSAWICQVDDLSLLPFFLIYRWPIWADPHPFPPVLNSSRLRFWYGYVCQTEFICRVPESRCKVFYRSLRVRECGDLMSYKPLITSHRSLSGRPLILPTYLSSPAFNFVAMSSYDHFGLLQYIRSSASPQRREHVIHGLAPLVCHCDTVKQGHFNLRIARDP
jgi:hypothetical protein